MLLNMNFIPYLPEELVNEIADYHNYDKYCKPRHKILLKNILNDIKDMSEIMPRISPNLAYQCWGAGAKNLPDSFENENMVGLYDDDYEDDGWNDDEENNFGMDYGDTHYYGNDEDEYEAWLDMNHFEYEGGGWYN